MRSHISDATARMLAGADVDDGMDFEEPVPLSREDRLAFVRARGEAYKARRLQSPSPNSRVEAGGEDGGDARSRSPSPRPSIGGDKTASYFMSVGAIFAVLAGRKSMVSGEQVVAGAVALLVTELLVEPQEALRILEEMQKAGYLESQDGWRAVILRTDHVADGEIRVQVLRGRRRRAVPGRPEHGPIRVAKRRQYAAVARRTISPAKLLEEALAGVDRELVHMRQIYPDHERIGAIEAEFVRIQSEWTARHGDSLFPIESFTRRANQLLVDLFLLRRGAGG
ncbi:hypothetical protein HY478_03780 [Candidatus Uhrbacteria bacterium]|nr:hypothetical protein [Candidatus Uhrbacteria bacterium]